MNLRFELNFVSTGEIKGIGHQQESRGETDDELVDGTWRRELEECRVRIMFTWSDMKFRGFMDGLGRSHGQFVDREAQNEKLQGTWKMLSCGSVPTKTSA